MAWRFSDREKFKQMVQFFGVENKVQPEGKVTNSAHKFLTGIDEKGKAVCVDYYDVLHSLFSKIEELDTRINQTWDTMSERLADFERHFQFIDYPKSGITPWDLERAKRLYLDELDKNPITDNKFPIFEELDLETQFDYIRRVKAKK